MIFYSFIFASEALVGKYFGARQKKQLENVVRLLFIWGAGLAFAFTVIYSLGIDYILTLLTSQQDVLQSARPYLLWVILIPFASFGSFIWDGIFIGATASAAMRNTLLAATALVFAPVYYLLSPYWENHALWLAMVLFMFARGVVQTFQYKRSILSGAHIILQDTKSR